MAKDTKTRDDETDDETEALQPSTLDPMTHAEMGILYAESTETLRFVKNHQWKTVGATLITFVGLVFVAGFVGADKAMANKLMGITILLTCAVIFTLVLYQFWMHNELAKIGVIEKYMSSNFKRVRSTKSKREGNVHRYLLLSFMMIVVILGAVVVHLAFGQLTVG